MHEVPAARPLTWVELFAFFVFVVVGAVTSALCYTYGIEMCQFLEEQKPNIVEQLCNQSECTEKDKDVVQGFVFFAVEVLKLCIVLVKLSVVVVLDALVQIWNSSGIQILRYYLLS
jgi:hypothetical protein